ncbi:MAG: glutathione-disulfide reductase [Gammaproteobacteria bacterium]
MAEFDYDLIVIGGGSGGIRASRMAARLGVRVAVVEAGALGGTCVNVGCIPKKLFYYGAEFSHDFQDAVNYGWSTTTPEFNWATLRDNKTQEINRLNDIYLRLLEESGVTLIRGYGHLVDPHTVEVNQQLYTAERILIATGNVSRLPIFPGAEHAQVSEAMFYLPEFPQHVVIIGGGYIACEFATIFSGLGAKVVQVVRSDKLLSYFDRDVGLLLEKEFHTRNIDVRFNEKINKLERVENKVIAHLGNGETLTTDLVLYAAGRVPNTAKLGLAKIGVKLSDRGAVLVNDQWQSSVPSIYAVGDVIDRYQLTPVALAEAMAFVRTVYGDNPAPLDYTLIPTAVFSDPNIGTVGLSEEEARLCYEKIKIFKSQFRPLLHTITGRHTQAFVKLIVEAESDKVVGIHVVGANAGEIVQGFAVALTAGATKAMFDATLGIHPTMAEELVTLREPAIPGEVSP